MNDISRDSVIRFLSDRGDRVANHQLLEHFRPLLTVAPPGEARTAARQLFKDTVNEVASVRLEDEVKYVCLRKKYRRAATVPEPSSGEDAARTPEPSSGEDAARTPEPSSGEDAARTPEPSSGEDAARTPEPSSGEDAARTPEPSSGEDAARTPEPSSGEDAARTPEPSSGEDAARTPEPSSGEDAARTPEPSSGEDPARTPEPSSGEDPARTPEPSSGEDTARTPEPSSGEDAARTPEPSSGEDTARTPEPSSGEDSTASPGSHDPPRISVTQEPESQAAEPPPEMPDVFLLSGRTPRSSRRGAREPVSPQMRRGGLLLRAGVRDSDSSSLHSSSSVSGNEEDDGAAAAGTGSAALEPLEHAWMVSSCRARWDSLQELLLAEPGLITRRDFITGFSCLHWAAKHGQHELLAALLTHARQHTVPVNINARASGGYTALHLAAMHGHLDVIKLLVGAYDADLDVRDYSGRKAWQYLSPDTARDVLALVGASPAVAGQEDGGSAGSGRWRLSRVLPAQLIVHRLAQLPEDEQDGGGRHIGRKGSGGRARLNKIRFRTQIIHSNLCPRDPDNENEEDRLLKSPMRHRPKSNVFG
ncbi:ankyrin repeat domain-containing protein SOWAHC [Ranitomeya variabilis]|uniref:ankyrin repeat domain-containing protein SOWAHC n=1 Tax=Ranitomeya variabilis TaxID=490064 RepID=UPI004056F4A6